MEGREIESLTITGAAHDGRGVGRHEGRVVFVSRTAVGDVIRCRVLREEKRMLIGETEEILVPSPLRVEPPCPYFERCGGCAYQHISYRGECDIKQARVEAALSRIGGVELGRVLPILGAKEPFGYRNNVQLAVEPGPPPKVGYRMRGSHAVVDVARCLLLPGGMMAAAHALREYLREAGPGAEAIHHLCLRSGGGEMMATVIAGAKVLPREDRLIAGFRAAGVDTLCLHRNPRPHGGVFAGSRVRVLYGRGYLTDTLCSVPFRLSPASFFQVNRSQAQRLYETAREYAGLQPGETLLDLYCGTGAIGLIITRDLGSRLIGVERTASAVEDARENAARIGAADARFILGDAGVAAALLEQEGIRPDAVVVDPPRKGCEAAALAAIARLSPARVVYLSCDAATLARDVARMAGYGYRLEKARPVDLFPRTPHVECVVLMSNK